MVYIIVVWREYQKQISRNFFKKRQTIRQIAKNMIAYCLKDFCLEAISKILCVYFIPQQTFLVLRFTMILLYFLNLMNIIFMQLVLLQCIITLKSMDYIAENQDRKNNKKVLYKVEKLKIAEAVFYCECGKNYLSFPALYLHCRSKHDVRLTTKISQNVCSIKKQGHYQKVTYFLNPIESLQCVDQQNKQDQKNSSINQYFENKTSQNVYTQKRVENNLQYVLGQYSIFEEQTNFQKNCLKKLMEYAIKRKSILLKESIIPEQLDQINSIPFILNSFIFSEFNESEIKLRKQQIGQTLLRFCSWLYENKFTKHQIQYSPTWSF